MAKFQVVFVRDKYPYDHILVGEADSLEEAKEQRRVSGDIVVEDTKVVKDPAWLWDFEKSGGYALKCINSPDFKLGPKVEKQWRDSDTRKKDWLRKPERV